MPKVKWVVSYRFCSKFLTLSSGAKILKMDEDLTKLQTVKWWERFLRHGVVARGGRPKTKMRQRSVPTVALSFADLLFAEVYCPAMNSA